jgi:membrane-associated phospholipid phosphatase
MRNVLLILILSLISFNHLCAKKSSIEESGDITQIALPIGAALISIYPMHDYSGLVDLTQSYATTFALTYALKYSVNAARPVSGSQSFPSGHTSSAFSGAAYLQHRYGWKIGAPAMAIAAWTGFSRVYADKHYIHDVLAGAILATCVSCRFVESGFTITPKISDEVTGVELKFDF